MKEEITIPIWYNPGGGMMYKRDCLPEDHPESTYNYIKREFGVNPELYGVKAPIVEEKCPRCGFNSKEEEDYANNRTR